MTAILLAAGIGKRMGSAYGPKCLLSIGGRSLLRRLLEALRAAGVMDVVIVVGFGKEQVMEEARQHAGQMSLTPLDNPRYPEGAILSLWTARSFLNREVLIMDTDVLFPTAVLERMINSPQPNCILVDGSVKDHGEEQMVFGQDGRVLQITKRPSEELKSRMVCLGESLGFLKLSKEGAGKLSRLLDQKVQSGITDIEHEQVYPDLFSTVTVGHARADGFAWIEIDTPADLTRAQTQVYPLWTAPPCLNRILSRVFLPGVVKLPVTPNQWTLLSLLVGLLAVLCVAEGSYRAGVLGAVLFQLFYLIDNWDGEVARLRGLSSRSGAWFDIGVDAVVQVSLALGLAVGLIKMGAPSWIWGVGTIAALGLALDMGVTAFAKTRGFGPSVYGDPSRGSRVASDSPLQRWIRTNLTNENLSLLVAAVLLLNVRMPFLLVLAGGSHCFWIAFLCKQRRRLWIGSH